MHGIFIVFQKDPLMVGCLDPWNQKSTIELWHHGCVRFTHVNQPPVIDAWTRVFD